VVQAPTTTALGSDNNPSTYGQAVTFTATVSPSVATGTVQFLDNGNPLGAPVTLSGGTAANSTAALTAGTHSITASYSGDANFVGSTSSALSQQVNQAATATALSSDNNPSTYGQTVTFTAAVSPSTATGTVQFLDNGNPVGSPMTLSGGVATYSTAALTAGTHSITASYSGDTNFVGSTSSALSQQINQASTTIVLSSNSNPSTYGQTVTFTATVSASAATGTVQFLDNGNPVGTPVTLSGGVATYSTTALTVGTHSITASYGGDTNFVGSTSTALSQEVDKASTTTALSSDHNPSTYGQTVTFTATVSPSAATGTVQFLDNGNPVCSPMTLSGGVATYLTTALTAGTHSITASYGGDTNFVGSTSSALNQEVDKASTTTALSSDHNPSTYGQTVTFTATVSPSTATGTVQFLDNGNPVGLPMTLSGGVATYSTAALTAGTHTITASYSGDTNFVGSTSSPLSQEVDKASTTTALSSDHNPSTYGQTVTFTATVSPSTATGTVQFLDNGNPVGLPMTLSGGAATYSTAALSVGTHSITASYSGDTNFVGSTSSPLSQQVNQATTTTGLSSDHNPSTYGQTVTFTATVSPSTATGTVQFLDNGNPVGTPATLSGGVATYLTTALTAGTHSITASYGGDTNFVGSTSSALSQEVDKASTTTALSSDHNPSTFGQTVTFTATVSPSAATGTVQFLDNGNPVGTPMTLSGGVATYLTTALTAGTHSITASYGGDTNFVGSTSSPLSQQVNQATTTTALSSDHNPSTYGQTVMFTATVSPSTATGTVQFLDNGNPVGLPMTLSGGTATYSTAALSVGTHSITASYGGDTNFVGSASSALSQEVDRAATTTALSSDHNPSTYGQTVTFTATVSPSTATGTVQFLDNGNPVGVPMTLSGGTATYSTGALSVGTHSITASYGGDTNFVGSTSSVLSQEVDRAATTTGLSSDHNPSTYAQTVVFTATVSPSAATGTVQFLDNGSPLGSPVTLSGGTAAYSTAALTGDTHSITASYGGDTNFVGSTSSPLSQEVDRAATTIALSSNNNPSIYAQTVMFTATVSPSAATGTVQFLDNGNPVGSPVTLSGGVASYSTAALTVGTHSITASYSGDTNFVGSTSLALSQEVSIAASTTSLTVPSGIGFHQKTPPVFSVVVTASNGTTPSGSVILYDGSTVLATMPPLDGNGKSSIAFSRLRPGAHNIHAVYPGDSGNHLNGSASTSQAVYVSPHPYLH
jgi:hypothetical protein